MKNNLSKLRSLCLLSCGVLISLCVAPSAWSKNPSQSKYPSRQVLPPLLQELEAKYSKAETLMAQFSQTTETAAFKQKKISTGILMFKRPNKVRWETLMPDPNLLVSNGVKVWFYTPPFDPTERGQVIERPASMIQTKLAHALLSGAFSTALKMKIVQKSSTRFELYPKKGSAGTVIRAEINVDSSKKLIEKVILEHRGGNRAEITLTEIQLGKKIEDSYFQFVAPSNTDRINE